jgi:ureidoacrylate peracid hydrolase
MHDIGISDEIIERVMQRRGRVHLYDNIDPAKAAFVVIDMQNAFCKEGAPVEVPLSRGIVPNINKLASELRRLGGDVVWIVSEFAHHGGRSEWENFFTYIVASKVRQRTMSYMEPGAEGTVLWHELDRQDGDISLVKNRYSCLAPSASTLERVMRSRGIETLLIAGTKTNICCETTARDAFDMDFKVVMVSDCCAALSDREHQAALESIIQQFGDVMNTDEVLARMQP